MKRLFFFFLIYIISCNKTEKASMGNSVGYAEPIVAADEEMKSVPESSSSNALNLNTYDRKIIKNAFLIFESDKPEENVRSITQLVTKNQGYVISNNQSKLDNVSEFKITFKVPFQRFDAVLLEIEKSGGIMTSKNVSSDDVTEEFYDNESQLKAKKELEIRYLQLVKQAKTIKDMLELEAKLSEVRTDIERIQGRQRFLTNNTQYSEFQITIVDKQSTLSNNYFSKLFNAFKNGIDNIFSAILWVIEMLPFLAMIYGLYIFIKKRKFRVNFFNRTKE